jgi:hypothetical protein
LARDRASERFGAVTLATSDPGVRLLDPVGFFDSAVAVFEAARERRGLSTERFVRLGPHVVRLDIAGSDAWERMTRALQHLVVPAAAPSLVTLIWDDASTGSAMPAPPWRWETAPLRRGEIYGYNTPRICTAYDRAADVLTALDLERRLAVYWTRDVRRLPGYEAGAPFRTLWHWFAAAAGGHVAHTAALGTPGGGVLLAGKGGSGKSTAVLACLESPLQYVGDDYCLLTSDPVPWVHALYSSAKLHAHDLRRFPHLEACVSNPADLADEKALVMLHERLGGRLLAGCPVRAILLPSVRGAAHTSLRPATPAEALRALALTAISQYPRTAEKSLAFLTRFVHALPCYHLLLGEDLARLPDVIGAVIADPAPSECRS